MGILEIKACGTVNDFAVFHWEVPVDAGHGLPAQGHSQTYLSWTVLRGSLGQRYFLQDEAEGREQFHRLWASGLLRPSNCLRVHATSRT